MPIICDGCNVREPWEHRCHGSNAYINGECTTMPCACPDCGSVNSDGRTCRFILDFTEEMIPQTNERLDERNPAL